MLNSGKDDSPVAKGSSSERNEFQNLASNKTLIDSLPYPAEGVEVVYTVDPVEAEAWLTNNIIDCSAEAVGFDIEWKPQFVSKKKGGVENKTAVLQLGVESSCLVLHLHNMKDPPNLLRSILNDEKILKIGSGILQDFKKLKRDKGLTCKGLVDTQKMAKCMGTKAPKQLGLKALAKHFLGMNMEKPVSITRSNWEQYPLTFRQIHYAALDAWIGFKLYQHMKLMKDEGQTHVEETQLVVDENPLKIVICCVCKKKCKGKDALSVLASHIKVHPQCKCGKFFQATISKTHKKNCPEFNPPIKQEPESSPRTNKSNLVLLSQLTPQLQEVDAFQNYTANNGFLIDTAVERYEQTDPKETSLQSMNAGERNKLTFGDHYMKMETLWSYPDPIESHGAVTDQSYGKIIATNQQSDQSLTQNVQNDITDGSCDSKQGVRRNVTDSSLSITCHVCKTTCNGEDALASHIKIHPQCTCGKFFKAKVSKNHKKKCPEFNPPLKQEPESSHPRTNKSNLVLLSQLTPQLQEVDAFQNYTANNGFWIDTTVERYGQTDPKQTSSQSLNATTLNHIDDKVDENPVEIVACHVCKKTCKGEDALASHIKIHPQCTCGKVFKDKVSKKHKTKSPEFNPPIKQEPESSPRTKKSNLVLLSQLTPQLQEVDAFQNYTANNGFSIDTTVERYEQTEPKQPSSQSMNAEERNKLTFGDHYMKMETLWSYPDPNETYGAVTDQSYGRNIATNQQSDQTLAQNVQNDMTDGNCDGKQGVRRNVTDSSLSIACHVCKTTCNGEDALASHIKIHPQCMCGKVFKAKVSKNHKKKCPEFNPPLKQEPESSHPRTNKSNLVLLSQLTPQLQEVDAFQNYTANNGFSIDTTVERYGHTDPKQTSSQSMNAATLNHIDGKVDENLGEIVACHVCKKTCKGEDARASHIKIHPQCTCGKVFKDKVSKKHKKKCPEFNPPIKQEPESSHPRTNKSNLVLLSQLTPQLQEVDAFQNYTANEGFWIDTAVERYEQTEPRQTFSRSMNAATLNHIDDKVDENPVEIVACHVCKKECKGKDALSSHIKIHPQCTCGKFFKDKVSKAHKRKCPEFNPLIKQEPESSPRTKKSNLVLLSQLTPQLQEVDAFQNYTANEGFVIDTAVERYGQTEPKETSSQSMYAEERNKLTFGDHYMRMETLWSYPDLNETYGAVTDQSCGRNIATNQQSDQTLARNVQNDMTDGNCDGKQGVRRNVTDSSLSIACHVCKTTCNGEDALASHIKIHPQCMCGKVFKAKVSKNHKKKCPEFNPPLKQEPESSHPRTNKSNLVLLSQLTPQLQEVDAFQNYTANNGFSIDTTVERYGHTDPKQTSSQSMNAATLNHIDDKVDENLGEIVACHVCKKTCKGKDALASHIKIHPQCMCGKVFKDKVSKIHRKICPELNSVSAQDQAASDEPKQPSSQSMNAEERNKLTFGDHYMKMETLWSYPDPSETYGAVTDQSYGRNIATNQLSDQTLAQNVQNGITDRNCDGKQGVRRNVTDSSLSIACHVCKTMCNGEDALASHIKIHPQCMCGKVFKAKISKNHKKNCPELNSASAQDQAVSDDISCCQACGKKYTNKEQLMKHIRDVGHVQCPFCMRLLDGPKSTTHIKKCNEIINEEWKQTYQ